MPRMETKVVNNNLYEMTKFAYRCNICNDIVNSVDTQVSVTCKCDNLTLRGGTQYGGIIAAKFDSITDISEWKLVK
uniref:DUF7695 domain-containing protein n=1 Tax=viral metagenome TaxID=1070528 RepID=A0A6C0JP15_9ZZZZ